MFSWQQSHFSLIIARHNFRGGGRDESRMGKNKNTTASLISSILIWTDDKRNYTRFGLFCGKTRRCMTIEAKKKLGNCVSMICDLLSIWTSQRKWANEACPTRAEIMLYKLVISVELLVAPIILWGDSSHGSADSPPSSPPHPPKAGLSRGSIKEIMLANTEEGEWYNRRKLERESELVALYYSLSENRSGNYCDSFRVDSMHLFDDARAKAVFNGRLSSWIIAKTGYTARPVFRVAEIQSAGRSNRSEIRLPTSAKLLVEFLFIKKWFDCFIEIYLS